MKIFHPRAVHVRIASGCNLGCSFCEREMLPLSGGGHRKRSVIYFGDGRRELDLTKDMSLETWQLVKERLMPFTDNMELGGLGEPTLGKIFCKAASDIVAAQKNLFFFTNGHYLNRPDVLEAVGESPRLSVSIDAGTPDAYKRIRGGDLEELITAVKAFRKAKPKAKINSQFTAIVDNVEELPAWVTLCASLGIGRRENDEELLMVGADHHVSDRINQSIRFNRDATVKAIARAREIAQREGLWFIAKPPPFSSIAPNAAIDQSDPNGFRRYTDFLFGANPCDDSVESILGASNPWLPSHAAPESEEREIIVAPRELYVDYDGACWTCLARHVIGHVQSGDWRSIVEENIGYQEFLANWNFGTSNSNKDCKSCPRRK